MKRLILSLQVLLMAMGAFAQKDVILSTKNGSRSAVHYNVKAQGALYAPNNTGTPTLNGGKDSSGAMWVKRQTGKLHINVRGYGWKEYATLAEADSMDQRTISVTHAGLLALIAVNGLKPDVRYKITDFRSVMFVPGKTRTNISMRDLDIPPHDLIVRASSVNTLYPEALDTEFPTDIVHYDITGAQGGSYYPNNGTGRGWIYYREWRDYATGSLARSTSYTKGFDGRNAVVPIYAVDLRAMNGDSITHCSLTPSGWLYQNSSNVSVNVTPLDTAIYDSITNKDGVKYHFMFGNQRTWTHDRLRHFGVESGTWSGQVPKLYWEYSGTLKNSFGGIQESIIKFGGGDQIFVGKYGGIYEATIIKPTGIRILNSPAQITWIDAGGGGYNWAGDACLIGDNFLAFKCLNYDAKFGWDNLLGVGGFSGVISIKANTVGSINSSCKIGHSLGSEAYIDMTAVQGGWGQIKFDNCRVKLLSSIGSNPVKSFINLYPGYNESGYFEITGSNLNLITQSGVNNMKVVHNLTTTPVSGTTLTVTNKYAGVIELTTAVGSNSINTLSGSYMEHIIIENNSSQDFVLTSDGTIKFPVYIVAPLTIPTGTAVALKRFNGGWLVGN